MRVPMDHRIDAELGKRRRHRRRRDVGDRFHRAVALQALLVRLAGRARLLGERQPRRQRLGQELCLPRRIAGLRAASKAHQQGLQGQGTMESITDVAPATVAATFAQFGIDTMIHGHTHRPAVHDGDSGKRIVLGDWYEQGSVLRVDASGMRLESL